MTRLLLTFAPVAFVLLCTLLPFLPGRYYPLAVPLSLMAQVFGYLGLLQAPPAEVERRQGWYAVVDSPHPHWKYFRFD